MSGINFLNLTRCRCAEFSLIQGQAATRLKRRESSVFLLNSLPPGKEHCLIVKDVSLFNHCLLDRKITERTGLSSSHESSSHNCIEGAKPMATSKGNQRASIPCLRPGQLRLSHQFRLLGSMALVWTQRYPLNSPLCIDLETETPAVAKFEKRDLDEIITQILSLNQTKKSVLKSGTVGRGAEAKFGDIMRFGKWAAWVGAGGNCDIEILEGYRRHNSSFRSFLMISLLES